LRDIQGIIRRPEQGLERPHQPPLVFGDKLPERFRVTGTCALDQELVVGAHR
jgi:hypothetical protein